MKQLIRAVIFQWMSPKTPVTSRPGRLQSILLTSTFSTLRIGKEDDFSDSLFRRMNLELEKEYGKQVWTSHLQQTEDATNFT